MAKSTTTTKAKTKTTKKKPTVKAAVKTTKTTTSKTKKATVKATTKTTQATQTSAVKVTNHSRTGTTSFLSRGFVMLAALYTLLALAAGYLMNTSSAQVLLGHLTKDELKSQAGTVLAPAAHVLYDVEYRWLLVILLAAAAIIALLRATRYRAMEEAGIKNRVQPLRWVEFAITGLLAFELAALMNGLQDAVALKLAMVSIALAALFAWMFERENAATGKPARSSYIAAAVAVAIPVLALLVTMYGTYVYGMERSPWYAYAVAGIVSLSLLVTVRSVWSNYKAGRTTDYVRVDRKYNMIAAVSKVAIAAVLIIGLYNK